MAENKQPRVILPHSSVEGKLPLAENALAGELYVNSASGNGVAFISTKKADNTIATFHEDTYFLDMITEDERVFAEGLSDLDTRVTALEENDLEERVSNLEDTIGDINSILESVLYNF